ncbi:MAG: glycosyltransferase family 39 protein, partial [Planctomycetota bacterium]
MRGEQRDSQLSSGRAALRRGRWTQGTVWALLMGVALSVRLVGITTTSVWHDEAMSIHTARMGLYDLVVGMSVANNQPPLFFLLVKLWAVVSWSPLWLRLFSVMLSLGSVIFAVLWVRHWDSRAGWLAGLLAATSPIMVHYGQEIRAYALLYGCMLAGLYCAERLVRRPSRGARVGLLVCACLMSYAHYVGLPAAAALWIYVWVRGAGLRQAAKLACIWTAVAAPVLALGVYHHFGHHPSIELWEMTGATIAYSWAALVMRAFVAAGVGLALIAALSTPRREARAAAGSMFAVSLGFSALIVIVSLTAVPIALTRTTFPAFVPLLGAMALAGAHRGRGLARGVGTACCLLVAAIWAHVSVSLAASEADLRPQERRLFGAVAERLSPADVVVVFPAEMQAGAGYFLGHRADARQIHCTELSRLQDSPDGLRLRPIPRTRNPAWFDRVLRTAADLRGHHPQQHRVWLMDLGPRSA